MERVLEVFMDQNNKCNLRCTMCGFSDPRVGGLKKFDMPPALFELIAREVFPHARYLALSCMTEPLMTRDFPARLRLLAPMGVPFTEIITNGTLLTERVIDEILAVPLSRLTISIDGATKEIYEQIRVGARFDRVIANVRLFNERKRAAGARLPALRINHVVSQRNLHQFDQFLGLAESLEPEAVDVRTIIRMSNAIDMEPEEGPFYDRIREARRTLEEWCKRTGVQDVGYLRHQGAPIDLFLASGQRRTCERPWNTIAIHANGDVMPCISWTRPPVGNLARQSFDEIWNGETLAAIRAEFTAVRPGIDCQHCTIKKNVSPEVHDDFFFRMIAKTPPGEIRER
jgi:radical SAM protein with 4Fe4S-binding SPASM domain